jgi:hypothetical protein
VIGLPLRRPLTRLLEFAVEPAKVLKSELILDSTFTLPWLVASESIFADWTLKSFGSFGSAAIAPPLANRETTAATRM